MVSFLETVFYRNIFHFVVGLYSHYVVFLLKSCVLGSLLQFLSSSACPFTKSNTCGYRKIVYFHFVCCSFSSVNTILPNKSSSIFSHCCIIIESEHVDSFFYNSRIAVVKKLVPLYSPPPRNKRMSYNGI